MSEAELRVSSEPNTMTPRFAGDPAAAAALARYRAQRGWIWAWLCVLLCIAAWVGFAYLVANGGGPGPQDDMVIAIGLAGAALPTAIAIILFCRVYFHRKTAAMADVCDTMNFHFTEKATKEQLGVFAALPVFNRGHGRRGHYLMEGEVAHSPVSLMEYCYTTGHGKTAQAHRQTVVVLQGVEDLPDFELRPKSFWRRISELLGMAAIPFETNPAFAKAYEVRGADVNPIRDVFTHYVVGYFAANPNWTVESRFGSVAVYRQDKNCAPEECPERVAAALGMLRLLHQEDRPTNEAGDGESTTGT